jgi:hypothetical protein
MSPPDATHYQNDQGYGQQGYGQQQGYDQQPSYDPQLGFNHAAQQAYVQPEPQHFTQPAAGYDPYQAPQSQTQTRQPTMPQSYEQYSQPYEAPRSFVASPPPMDSPPYSPRPDVNTAVANPISPRGPRSAGAGPSQPSAPAQRWSGGEEGSSNEPPPPQYDAVGGVAGATGYPSEKR